MCEKMCLNIDNFINKKFGIKSIVNRIKLYIYIYIYQCNVFE